MHSLHSIPDKLQDGRGAVWDLATAHKQDLLQLSSAPLAADWEPLWGRAIAVACADGTVSLRTVSNGSISSSGDVTSSSSSSSAVASAAALYICGVKNGTGSSSSARVATALQWHHTVPGQLAVVSTMHAQQRY
jgi:hypothetical protein